MVVVDLREEMEEKLGRKYITHCNKVYKFLRMLEITFLCHRCSTKACNAKIFLLENTVVAEGQHNSTCKVLDQRGLQRHLLFTAVKRQATDNLDAPPAKIVRRELRDSDFNELLDVDLKRVCRTGLSSCKIVYSI